MYEIKVYANGNDLFEMEFEGTLREALEEADVQVDYWTGEGYINCTARVNGKRWDEYEGVTE